MITTRRARPGLLGAIVATIAMTLAGAAVAAEPGAYRLGVLILGAPATQSANIDLFFRELAQRGLIEGRNLVVERRYAEKFGDAVDAAARDLVALKPDVLVTTCGFRCAQAAQRHTSTIPIVFDAAGNPVTQGLTTDLARPSGNLTGSAVFGSQLDMKRFELLREATAKATIFAVLEPPLNAENRALEIERLAAFDKAHNTRTQLVEAAGPADLPAAFERMVAGRVEAVVVASSPLVNLYCRDIAELAAKYRLPSIGDYSGCVDAGMMMVYMTDFAEVYRQAAEYTSRLLKGAKPADLPIVQAARFRLIINMKVAQALGAKVPHSLLLRADRVIE